MSALSDILLCICVLCLGQLHVNARHYIAVDDEFDGEQLDGLKQPLSSLISSQPQQQQQQDTETQQDDKRARAYIGKRLFMHPASLGASRPRIGFVSEENESAGAAGPATVARLVRAAAGEARRRGDGRSRIYIGKRSTSENDNNSSS